MTHITLQPVAQSKTLEVSLDFFFLYNPNAIHQQIALALILNCIQILFTSHDLHPYHLNPNHYQLSATTGASDFIFYHTPTALSLTNWKSEFILARIRSVSAIHLRDSWRVMSFRPSLNENTKQSNNFSHGFLSLLMTFVFLELFYSFTVNSHLLSPSYVPDTLLSSRRIRTNKK